MCVILCALLSAALADSPETVRYLRPQGGKYVLESEVKVTPGKDGSTYVSRTERPGETLTLTVQRDVKGRAVRAEIVSKKGDTEATAKVELKGTEAKIEAGGKTQTVQVGENPVVTSAPDWSDILALVERYDRAKAGKQDFAGLWFHPTQAHRLLTFSVEKEGADKVKAGEKEVSLDRYKVTIRSGSYKVWALANGRVCRIVPPGEKAIPVVLEGYEEGTKELK